MAWTRPSDWLAMPTVTSSESKFVGLHAVFPNGNNFAALKFTTNTGQYQVDWGDGTVTLHNSNTLAQKQYTYSAISNTTETTRGYRQVIITVTPVSGVFTACDLNQRSSLLIYVSPATGFLDGILSMPNATTGQSVIVGGATARHVYCERFEIKNFGAATNLFNLFYGMFQLQEVILASTSNVTSTFSMFSQCYSIQEVPLFDTSLVTTMTDMFNSCHSLLEIPLFVTTSVTTMLRMFINCKSLTTIPLIDTRNVTNMSSMFNECNALESVPLLNTSKVTNMSSMFAKCLILDTVPLFDTGLVTNMSNMFYSLNGACLASVPLFNTQNVTNMSSFIRGNNIRNIPEFNLQNVTDLSNAFGGNLYTELPAFSTAITTTSGTDFGEVGGLLKTTNMVFTRTVTLTSLQLSRAALVNIFTNLADRTATTAATITITATLGATRLSSADRLIATSKNWTIVG